MTTKEKVERKALELARFAYPKSSKEIKWRWEGTSPAIREVWRRLARKWLRMENETRRDGMLDAANEAAALNDGLSATIIRRKALK